MSHICRNMEGSGKHRFHSLEHDSKTRLFKLIPHLYHARLRSLRENATPENLKRRTEDGKKGTEHSSEWQDRQVRELSLPQISEETGPEKRENGNYAEKEEKKQNAKALGSKAEE